MFLKELIKVGGGKFECLGIELLPELAIRARDNGVSVIQRDIDKDGLRLEPDSLDIIICLETIAHLISPIDILKEIHYALKPNGRLLLETVNSAYWGFRLDYLFARYKWGDPNYDTHYEIAWLEHKGLHLHHFSHNSLKELLESIGFEVICHCYTTPKWLHNFQMEIFFECLKRK